MLELKSQQYKDSSKFNARITLHAKFATNSYPWFEWVFDNMRKEDNLKVLELGCGNGIFWKMNAPRIPKSWDITLSDFSPGMLDDARHAIGEDIEGIKYEVVDIEHIPYESQSYDIVMANHMLYHVPDKQKALSEIRRVMKKDGVFYATTATVDYMKEMGALIKEYILKKNSVESSPFKSENSVFKNFSVENGEEQLEEYFSGVTLKIYKNSLLINEAKPLLDYIYSLTDITEQGIKLNKIDRELFLEFLDGKIKDTGSIFMTSDCGLFISRNE